VFTHRLLGAGSAWGTAFPSSHVAVALIAATCARRGARPLGAVLLPTAALLSLATVYGQLHYAVDVLAGIGLAVAALTADRRAGYDCSLTVPSDRTSTRGEPR
jgi:membrane-associated phospholipid phosphatase